MNEHQILKEPQMSKGAEIMNEPQILKEHQICKQTQITNNPNYEQTPNI